ncbi:hypothetical protein CVT25_008291 [Psilocybe cyanescens]|uniref:G domain-containing protein n=1 Tax=Psilocybe cyanescens TaxID=93625 RepID=A0A409X9J5_PSICY|nr:hypothetical protein CVT25_008291 [Psilocybe cyanescens]
MFLTLFDFHAQLIRESLERSPTSTLILTIDMADDLLDRFNVRQKYTHFRILVIGRANAGKTTLLQRVCNTTEDPRIYNEGKNLVRSLCGAREGIALKSCGILAGANLSGDSFRGIHDINHPFAFESNPQFIFHDSRGFESGDESQLKEVQAFIEERARSTEPKLQLHAIWFCFVPNKSRPLLELEERFFNEQRAGNAPVIAIFTKLDDLITQVFKRHLTGEQNRQSALNVLKDKFEEPLRGYKYPPKAYLHLENMQEDKGKHQDQVKELMEKTADSLDNLALQMLFVSVQSSNLELCIEYAIKQ